MTVVLLMALLVLPPALVYALRHSPMFWLPGGGLLALGCAAFIAMPSTHGDVGGMCAMAAGILALAGMALVVYGVICLAIGSALYARRPRTPAPSAVELPPAIVVRSVSKS